MKTERTEAIVIDSIDYGESDRIVTLYTALYGKIRGMAKGARRSRKRFPNTLETFSYIVTEVTKKGEGLYWLNYCSLINNFQGIREEIKSFAYGNLFLEMVFRFTGDSHPVPGLFTLLLGYLRDLGSARRPDIFTLVHSFRLLSILGYGPYIYRCVRCDREIKEGLFFNYKDGGLVCHNCSEGAIAVSPGVIKVLRGSLTFPLRALSRLYLSEGQKEEGFTILKGLIEYHLDKRLRSWRFIEQLGGKENEGGYKACFLPSHYRRQYGGK